MTSPIWYLRDCEAFPDPYSYDPYRWLTAAGDAVREDSVRDRFYIPFSKGSNICMGNKYVLSKCSLGKDTTVTVANCVNSFAYLELYLSVSQIIQHFQITSHYATTCVSGSGFEPIRLPSRKEWVAAVPSEKLEIILDPR